jgi:hypothetical protein
MTEKPASARSPDIDRWHNIIGEPTIADTEMPNDSRPAGRSPPGRHRSQSMAGVDRNLVADIIRNARPTSPESAGTSVGECPSGVHDHGGWPSTR